MPSRTSRLLGGLGIAGGLVLVAALLPLPWTWAIFNLRLVLFEAGAIAVIVAIQLQLPPQWRRPALLVCVPAILANAWHLVMSILFVQRPAPPEADPVFRPIYALAATMMWLLDVAFGLLALRTGAASRWGSQTLTVGGVLAMLGVSGLGMGGGPTAELIDELTVLGVVLVGLAWIILGIDVATRRRDVPQIGLKASKGWRQDRQ